MERLRRADPDDLNHAYSSILLIMADIIMNGRKAHALIVSVKLEILGDHGGGDVVVDVLVRLERVDSQCASRRTLSQ